MTSHTHLSLEYEDSVPEDESYTPTGEDSPYIIPSTIYQNRHTRENISSVANIESRIKQCSALTSTLGAMEELNAEIGVFLNRFSNLYGCFRLSSKNRILMRKIDFIADDVVSHIIKMAVYLGYQESMKSTFDGEAMIEKIDALCNTSGSYLFLERDIVLSKNKSARHAYKLYTVCKKVGRAISHLKYRTSWDLQNKLNVINTASKFVCKFSEFVITIANELNQ